MSDDVLTGMAGFGTSASDGTSWLFLVQQAMAGASHVALVKVMAVNPSGVGAGVGTISVQPMVHQIDGKGATQPHGTIQNLAYSRIQGGANAIVMDPVVGDIGVAVFCDRDISAVKKTQQPSQPGSFRRFDWADGVYLQSCAALNGAPTQTIEFMPGTDGIKITSPFKVTIDCDLHVTGAVIAGFGGGDQVGLQTHLHNQPADSHGDTEEPTDPPTAGT